MTLEKLTENFFARSPDIVAKELLGKYITRVLGAGTVKGMITEVAAYQGKAEKTSSKIKTAPGKLSVSTKYGNHLLDISTGKEGEYSCVTLRAAEFDWQGQKQMVNGPGKLCKALKIRSSLNGLSVYNNELWIEDSGMPCNEISIETGNMPSNCIGYYRKK